jgi:hypothetical protein
MRANFARCSFVMGIRFACPNGHNLNVKEHLAGKRGICPNCGAKFVIPTPEPASPAVAGTAIVTPSGEFGPPSGLIRVSEPPPTLADLEDIPDSVVVGIPARPVAAPPPVATVPVPLDLDMPSETGSVVVPIVDSAATVAPSMEELLMPPVGDAPVVPVEPEPGIVDRRRSGRRLQLVMAILLLLTVIILAGVLVWVLRRKPPEPTAARDNKVRLAQLELRPYIVDTCSG